VEDFARTPDLYNAKLSPDGKCMGYVFVRKDEDRTEMAFLDLQTNRARSAWGSTQDFAWVSNNRVAVIGWGGLHAVNRDTTHWLGLTGWARRQSFKNSTESIYANEIIHASGQDPERILLLDRNSYHGERILYPDVLAMDTRTGRYQEVLRNPGNVIAWMADWEGVVRFGLAWAGKTASLTYRETATAPWQGLPGLGATGAEPGFAGLDRSGRIVHLALPSAKGRWGIFPYDLGQKRLGEADLANDEYDIVPPDFIPNFAGVPLAATLFSPKTHEFLGVRYVTEGPQQHWFDPAFAALQRQLDAMYPDLTNTILDQDHAGERVLVLSWSAREPGFYSLVDLASGKVSLVGRRMPWIKPEQMAEMFPIACTARDGLPLHGYLTLPPGRGQKNLPLVMLVHGGPWVRDVWGFDHVVQFLANRGYAVLQINYRGSIGYGLDFAAASKGQIGGAIQDDITDAVRWAIQKGFADPKRIAIMGASYGGYSTLFALAKEPGLYRCGIDVAGVTDWPALRESREQEEYKIAAAYWEKRVGSMKDEAVHRRLAEVSPVNFAEQIRAPLLIVHGKEDQVVPLAQSKKLVSLLKKNGHEPKTLYFGDLGHSLPRDKQGVEFLNKLEAFLGEHLGAAK